MKNIIKLFVFAAVLFVPVIVFGQGSGSYEPSPGAPATVESLRNSSNFAVTRAASGTIVGLKEGILTIKIQKDKEVRVAILKDTKFKLGKKTLNPDELSDNLFKEGQAVKITYMPFEDQRVDKAALEIRFVEDKQTKEKPKLG